MTAHVLYPALDPDWPATLSVRILNDLLRREMGYDGLIVTDNMEMRGVWGRYAPAQLTRRAVEAGCDLFIGGGGGLDGRHPQTDIQFELMETLTRQIESGEVDAGRAEASLARTRRVKSTILPLAAPAETGELSSLIGAPAHRALAKELARAAARAWPRRARRCCRRSAAAGCASRVRRRRRAG
jgi:beta-N-acetylhexosaminidase